MLRVLVLCEYASLNGGEHSLLEAAKRFPGEDVDVVVAAPEHGPLRRALDAAAVAHQPLRLLDERGARFPRAHLREQLRQLIERVRPTVVHANSVSMSRLSGPVVAQLGVASIGHLRDIMKLSAASLAELHLHSRLLAVSHATRRWYVGHGLAAENVFVEFNGVDLERFQPRPRTGALHAELAIEPQGRLIGNIGQIGARKGTDILLDAAAQILTRAPDAHLLLVGQRYSQKAEAVEFERKLHQTVVGATWGRRVHFLGVRRDIDRLLNELTLYVHSARQEPLGRVLLEAAAAGVPIVATQVGGTNEIFPAVAPAALLVPADLPDRLADAALQVLESRDLQTRLAAAARQRAVEAFDISSSSRRLVDHYWNVAHRRAES